MGSPSTPEPVRCIAGLLAASEDLLREIGEILAERIAPLDLVSAAERWETSRYYEPEMGAHLWRQYLSFAGTVSADVLVELKHETNSLEGRWRGEHGRRVNIDPGYLDLTKVVLATTKDAAHRIYLGRGIYAEATLRYVDGSFAPWPYTYPDYARPETCAFFNRVRARYRAQRQATLRESGQPAGRGGRAGA